MPVFVYAVKILENDPAGSRGVVELFAADHHRVFGCYNEIFVMFRRFLVLRFLIVVRIWIFGFGLLWNVSRLSARSSLPTVWLLFLTRMCFGLLCDRLDDLGVRKCRDITKSFVV